MNGRGKLATIKFKTADEYALKLSRLATNSDKIAKKAIYEGAGIVADQIRSNLNSVLEDSTQSTGELEKSLGISPIQEDRSGNWNAKIGFDGYDKKGTPNALKARVLESGSSHVQKRPFIRPAVNATRKTALNKMRQVIDEETQKQMK